MKKNLLLAILLVAIAFQLSGQNTVTLTINHLLEDENFAMDQAAKNNLDHDFKITRLEYYISEITLLHDEGSETAIEDLWILVDASTDTEVNLGTYDISSVDKVRFHIGVDPDHNHLDPATYPSGHPLAPRFPSMHWGWTAGYRFVALEGHGGSDLNQLVQLHGLGDNNYFATEIEVSASAENDVIEIRLDADYTKALEDISLSSGVIVHGTNFQAKRCLENFRDFVFSSSDLINSTIDHGEVAAFDVYPNPIVEGTTYLKLDLEEAGHRYDISITSADGKTLNQLINVSDKQVIDFSNQAPGFYILNLIKKGQTIMTKKVIVQ